MVSEVQTVQVDACPICGKPNIREWCKSRDRLYLLSAQQFSYSRCCSCGILFLSTRPDSSEAIKFYPTEYGPYNNISRQISQEFKKENLSFLKRMAHSLARFLRPAFNKLNSANLLRETQKMYGQRGAINFLDFGCGSEKFLNTARDNGWRTTGMDFSATAIKNVISHGHHGVLYESSKDWTVLPKNSFDAIRMNHVIEHLYDPISELKELFKLLRPGGVIHVATQNCDSLSASIFKTFWLGLDCPRHVIIYHPKALKDILERVGFKNVRVYQETVTKDLARSIGFWKEERGKMNHDEVLQLPNDKLLNEVLYGPAVLSSLIKRSDRIHAFAIK